ncbi:unnamed protein product [Brassicogethes aeneus]|uniref:Uncharacterized protein n=1 Tax=Brassicogethes aeneus TaxID=1431903 RepID=A0A9P0AKT1_BRAAE|nr:unnamed protein product [Brassicogethes aeneus]
MCVFIGNIEFLDWIIENGNCPGIVLDRGVNFNGSLWPMSQGTFVFIETPSEINKTISILLSMPFWDTKLASVIMITRRMLKGFSVGKFIDDICSNNLSNFAVTFLLEDLPDLQIYKYNHLDDRQIQKLALSEVQKAFSKKTLNFNHHPFRGVGFDYKPLFFQMNNTWVGDDYYNYVTYSSMLKATESILEVYFFAAAQTCLEQNKADFIIVSTFRTKLYNDVDLTYPHGIDKLVLLIPEDPKVPGYISFWSIADKYSWTCTFVSFLFVVFVLKLLGRKTQFQNNYITLAWRVLFLSSVPHLSAVKWKLKLFIALWVFTSIILMTTFSTSLTSRLISHNKQYKLQKISEVKDLNVSIYTMDYFASVVPPELGFAPNFIISEFNNYSFMTGHLQPGSYYLLREDMAKFYSIYILDDNKEPLFYILDEAFTYGLKQYILKKNSPYLSMVNKIVLLEREFQLGAVFRNKIKNRAVNTILNMHCIKSSPQLIENDYFAILKEFFTYHSNAIRKLSMCVFIGNIECLDWIIEDGNCPGIVLDRGVNFNGSLWPMSQGAFVFIETPSEINKTISILLSMPFWNTKLASVIMITRRMLKGFSVGKFIDDICSNNLSNFAVTFLLEDLPDLQIYKYNHLDDRQIQKLALSEVQKAFSKKTLNFNHHPFRGVGFDYKPLFFQMNNTWVGDDYYNYVTYSSMLKATESILEVDFFAAAQTCLQQNKGDFIIVSTFRTKLYNDVDLTYPHGIDKLVLLIPEDPKVPGYISFWSIADKYSWACTFLSFLFVVFVLKFLGRKTQFQNNYITLAWRVLFLTSVPHLSAVKWKLKLFIALWIFTSIILMTTFSSSLTSRLISHNKQYKLQKISEVKDLNVSIYTIDYFASVVPPELGLAPNFIISKFNNYSFMTGHLQPGSYYLLREDMAKYYSIYLLDDNKEPLFYILDEAFTYGLKQYILKKNSPYLSMVNKIVLLEREFQLGAVFRNKIKNRAVNTSEIVVHKCNVFKLNIHF